VGATLLSEPQPENTAPAISTAAAKLATILDRPAPALRRAPKPARSDFRVDAIIVV
jgi:hypothetical protein